MRRFPVLLVALLALLGAAPALLSGRPAAADPGGQVAGMVLSNGGQSESTADAMAHLKADGVNTVSLFVWWWTDSPQSTTLAPYSGTESDAALSSQIATARQYGLKVILSPIFYCGTCEGGWRGVMRPADTTAFFASYRAFIDHYAQLAQADGVWLLFAGSEMTTLEGQTSQWESIVSSARQYYSGQVGYEQNWDVLDHPQFLSDVDVVGVSAYFPLDDGPRPSVSQLMADWSNSHAAAFAGRNWVGDLTHLADTTRKPILFGEVGYMDSTYAGRQPFLNSFFAPDPQLQADLYQALLQTFSGYSWWMGVSWWEWSDSGADADRTPMGKPAEQLLQQWYVQGWRPSSAAPVPAPAGGASGAGGSSSSPPVTGGRATTTTEGAAGPSGSARPLANGPSRGDGSTVGAGGRSAGTGTTRGSGPAVAAPARGADPVAGGALTGDPAPRPGPEVLAAAPGSRPTPGFYALAALAAVVLALASGGVLADVGRRPRLAAARDRRRAAVRESLRSIPRR